MRKGYKDISRILILASIDCFRFGQLVSDDRHVVSTDPLPGLLSSACAGLSHELLDSCWIQ